jgi:hypothetical protein
LKSFPGQFLSGREVARRAGGKWKFHDDPNWAVPVLMRLKDQNLVESNASGQYRLLENMKKQKQKRWISPHLKKILEESGKDFAETVAEGQPGLEGQPKAKPQTGADPDKV